MIGMEAVAKEIFHKDPRRRKLRNGHVIAPLLEAPLPMPRRSCYGSAAADAPVPRRFSAADASPQCRHVPFSWETAPGVPKIIMGGNGDRVAAPPPPRPPPGRCGGPCRASSCHEYTTTDGSSEDGGGDTFSDALDRTSSSDRLALAALSARLSSIDGRGVAGSRRSPSFIMDRFLPAANVIAATSADKPRPRRSASPRRSVRRESDDDEEQAAAARARARARQVMMNAQRSCELAREQPKQQQSPPRHRQSKDAAVQAAQHVTEEEQCDDETSSARKCGLMFFFPWRAKPVLLSFPLSFPRSSQTSNASAASVTKPSPPRRSVTLGDVLEKERRLRAGGDLSRHWYEEKSGRSGKEWSRLGWGTGILGTSRRYCADARRALSRLARSATDGGGSPRLCRERRSGKHRVASEVGSASDMIPPLSPPSESWLSQARRSNARTGSNKR